MKAVIYDFSILRYLTLTVAGMITKRVFWSKLSPVRLSDVLEPKLPNKDWVLVKTILSGICASDMSAITMKDSPTLTPFASFPFIPGHENVGTIAEVGLGVKGFLTGDRVAVNPALSCEARGMEEVCASCKRGETSVCEMAAEGKTAVGVSTGYSKETGGGWSPYFLAHKSQLFKLDGISDDEGVMIDAFSSALHPVMRNFPKDNETVLIIGTGPIGLSAINSIRALGSKARVIVLERSRFSGELAEEEGCDMVVYPEKKGGSIYDVIAGLTGAIAYKPIMGDKILMGGVDKVFDTVGHSATINMSLRILKTDATYVLIGLSADEKLDLTPLWFKELKMVGTLGYGMEEYGRDSVHTWGVALDLIRKKKIDLKKYVTHKFSLEDYREAIKVNIFKEKYRAIKTAFVF